MKCSNCGGEILFENGTCVCSSCKSIHRVEAVFENTEVCICYLENDENGRRTKDSLIAAEVYKKLESKKINCFYEHISAENIIGNDLEIIRYAAVNCSKIIVLVGTSADNFSALYNKYFDAFGDKTLIPIISDMKPEQLPEELRRFQASNFDSLGALNDLLTSVLNLLGRDNEIELEEIYAKKQKKKKTTTVILASLSALLLCIASVLTIVLWPEKEDTAVLTNEDIYNYAIQLANEEKYLEAATEFSKILDYKDSNNQYKKIYDRYDGYYQDDEQIYSVYINVVDGKYVEFCFEKTIDNKVVKFEESILMENNKISGNYVDSLLNEGVISIVFSNELVTLNVSTTNSNNKICFGDVEIQFQVKNKTDRPSIKTVTKELLLRWIETPTTPDDVKTLGYELEYIEPYGDIVFPFGNQYKITNTDITIITSNHYLTKFTGEYLENPPTLDNDIIVAIMAPAKLICPERIGQRANTFSGKGIVYVPNATECNADNNNEKMCFEFFTNLYTNDIESFTITEDSGVGFASKKLVGEYNYNHLMASNDDFVDKLRQALVIAQFKKDNPDSSEYPTTNILAEKENSVLVCVHKYGKGETSSYHYYKLDLATEKCTFLATYPDLGYGLISIDQWKYHPEIFGEFLDEANENIEPSTNESTSSETIETPSERVIYSVRFDEETAVYKEPLEDEWGIGRWPSDDDVIAMYLPAGTYNIVGYRQSGCIWGKLEDDIGWICYSKDKIVSYGE